MTFPNINKRSSKVLSRFTISYLLLLLVPIIISIVAYNIALKNAINQVEHTNMLALERAASEVECSISEAKKFVIQLSSIDAINEFLDETDVARKNQTFTLRSAVSNLPEFKDTYGLIQRYFIYSEINGFIVDNRNAYFDFSKYYATTFRYGKMSNSEFQQWILHSYNAFGIHPVQPNIYLGEEYNSILYINLLMSSSCNFGRVVFYIDEAALIKRLQLHFGSNAEYVALLATDGSSLFLNGTPVDDVFKMIPKDKKSGSFTFQSSGSLVSYFHSNLFDSIFVVTIPKEYISNQLGGIKTAMITGMGFMLLIGIILALILLQHNRKPLAAMIDALPEKNGKQAGHSLSLSKKPPYVVDFLV